MTSMKKTIDELGQLCKVATEIEKKWDRAGVKFLETRMTRADYALIVQDYLKAVRRLEEVLSHHVTFMIEEAVREARDEN